MEKQYNLDSCFYALLELPTFQKRNNNDTLLIRPNVIARDMMYYCSLIFSLISQIKYNKIIIWDKIIKKLVCYNKKQYKSNLWNSKNLNRVRKRKTLVL